MAKNYILQHVDKRPSGLELKSPKRFQTLLPEEIHINYRRKVTIWVDFNS